MPVVPTRNLMDGMVLADAAAAFGKVVVPEGALINRQTVAMLAEAGIEKVRVTDESYGLAALIVDAWGAGGRNGATRAGRSKTGERARRNPADTTQMQVNLLRVAHMFNDYRDDPLMRELCRLAIRCAQERLISV